MFSGKKQLEKTYIRYDTRKGFDQEFNVQLECDLKNMLATMGKNQLLVSAIDRVLYNSLTQDQYPLQEKNVFEHSGFAILLCIPVQYSSIIDLKDMIHRLQWPIGWKINSDDDVMKNLLANNFVQFGIEDCCG